MGQSACTCRHSEVDGTAGGDPCEPFADEEGAAQVEEIFRLRDVERFSGRLSRGVHSCCAFDVKEQLNANNRKLSTQSTRVSGMSVASLSLAREVGDVDTDMELTVAPASYSRPRCGGVCATPPEASFFIPSYDYEEWEQSIRDALESSLLFKDVGVDDFDTLVLSVSVKTVAPKYCIVERGEYANALYVVLSGNVEVREDCVGRAARRPQFALRSYLGSKQKHSSLIGEASIMWNAASDKTVVAADECVLGRLDADVYRSIVVQSWFRAREKREVCLRHVLQLDALGDEQIMQLADILNVTPYEDGEVIIQQDEEGDEIFFVLSGECVASVRTFDDVQEVKRYGPKELFGELAFIRRAPRAATVSSIGRSEVMALDRDTFIRMFGPLSLLREQQYMNDPRKVIADGYRKGDRYGPMGSAVRLRERPGTAPETHWFAVFRPTSRDAIAKMLSGVAVGKGMNVKGKSAKKSRLSGYVPFLQISNNSHKKFVELCFEDARIKIFYTSDLSREVARVALSATDTALRDGFGSSVTCIDCYMPDVYGLDVPADVVRECYIMQPDVSTKRDWDMGRSSEPAFMNMNLKSVQGSSSSSDPEVVLYQYDRSGPMNPRGLLLAYAEEKVLPVVSDFDAFLVASKGMAYARLPPGQQKLMNWTVDRAEAILREPTTESWTSRWLNVLREMTDNGEHPRIPKYGFGDPTSYRLMGDIIAQTAPCGAVRHGAECFNFYFPQELDDEYLVIWESFPDKPWSYMSEAGLRRFLLERISDGFSFPLNPVWPLRDPGWYEVLEALRKGPDHKVTIESWYPQESGILQRIDEIHSQFPGGFKPLHRSENEFYANVRGLQLGYRCASLIEPLVPDERIHGRCFC
eukprot:TRINITY_DN17811_c0_g3_i1.p1 TRINITY_DN17811_c0_g3~~TRINITY_DN17811_c0_g3_i1.p1  ORF type:complete len:867 (+),score=146.38 TRINITY_DN17811_c0_g3_i1:128-2728(+)